MEDHVDLRCRRALGAHAKCGGGVFPSGFPHHVEELGPSHHFARIPTADGAASAAAALPRIVTAGGGRSYGIQWCQPRGYGYGYGNACERASSKG